MAFSEKFETGMDRSGSPGPRKLKTARLVGSIESGTDVISQSKRCGSARERRRYVKSVSVLLVVCAVAIVILSAVAMAPLGKATAPQTVSAKDRTPGMPHSVFGYTNDTDGVTPLNGCVVVIRNERTDETITWDENHVGWDPTTNIYSVDLSELQVIVAPEITAWVAGDMLNVTAWNPGGLWAGWNRSAVTVSEENYDRIDVTVDKDVTLIPEFPMVIVPVAGMIALFVVVGLRRRGEEQ